VSAGISQCSGFLKNVQNGTYLQILTEIKVTITFTLCIFSFHFEESKKKTDIQTCA
jgi:hypothetical protein